MKTLNIYNGTSHHITFYRPDSANFTAGRYRDELVLTNSVVQPSFILHQAIALNDNASETGSSDEYGVRLTLPRAINVDMLPDYIKYDCIVVSQRYAEAIIRRGQHILPDYADRLFIIDQKVRSQDGDLLGCCSFRKVFGFQSLDYYIAGFVNGQNPSLAAARLCYDYFSHQVANGYTDFRDKTYQLGNWIRSEENRRVTPQQFVFNV